MRGSIYYQTAQLAKVIFKEGVSKVERVDEKSENYKCVTSFSTMQSYKSIWNHFGKYLRDVWNIVRTHSIWPPRASALSQHTHKHLATSRIV